MKWVVGVLAVVLAAAVALGSVGYVSMRREISALQRPQHHATHYAPYSFAEALAGRLNDLEASIQDQSQSDTDLATTVDCIKTAIITGGSVLGC